MRFTLAVLLMLVSGQLWAYSQPYLYEQKVVDPGYEVTVKELRRQGEVSDVRVTLDQPDAQAGYAIIDAAVAIAQDRGAAYFVIIDNQPVDRGEKLRIFFTSDKNFDPVAHFGEKMSLQAKGNFVKNGYNNVQDLLKVFALMKAME